MIELFTALDTALQGAFGLALMAALVWGMFSVLLSPCHLTSIPLVVAYISSGQGEEIRRSSGLALVFSLGILASIALIGGITITLGRLLGDTGQFTKYLIGALLVLVGLYFLGVLRIPGTGINLQRLQLRGFTGAVVLGLLFGLTLGPCTFAFMAPVLGAVFQLSATAPWQAGLLLLAFGFGHCLVIVLAGTLTGWLQNYLKWTDKSRGAVILRKVCGILVIAGGIYLVIAT